ncbi:MAG: FtsX-like permease family protein [Bacteroidetes bacterium]|jgi:putative ABC transport system permease protein|nr:FtsX-like permease family protein [Bacteroidota bacterium]
MFFNYLKIAWRTLWRHRATTAVNLVGLSVGLAVCFLVVLSLHQQWQIDRFHPDSNRIHTVSSRHVVAEEPWSATAPGPLGPALRTQAPGVRAVTQLAKEDETFVTRGEKSVMVDVMYADSSFFDVFPGFRLRAGTRATALTTPHMAVLTTETARRLFGDADPVGQTLSLRGEENLTVTGVLAPPPGPTHLAGDLFLSYEPLDTDDPKTTSWTTVDSDRWTYLRLEDGTRPVEIQRLATALLARNVPADVGAGIDVRIRSLSDLRFGGTTLHPLSLRTQMPVYVFAFYLALAGLVLLAGGFNYVNLVTAQSVQRAKEIGVRKTAGAQRRQLIAQFLGEAILTSLLAAVGAVLLLFWIVPLFNGLYSGEMLGIPPLSLRTLANPGFLALLAGVAVVFGLAAGSYPTLVLSASRPSGVLKAGIPAHSPFGSLSVRTVLVGMQFAFALLLVVTATTLSRQSTSMAMSDHDLQTERLLSVELQDVEYEHFRRAARRLPEVETVTTLDHLMLGMGYDRVRLQTHTDRASISSYQYATDTTFIQTMGLHLQAAQTDWTVPFAGETGVVLNEAAAEALGFKTPALALGAPVHRSTIDADGPPRSFQVVGVVDDFPFMGIELYTPLGGQDVPPLLLHSAPSAYEYALVRSRTDDVARTQDRLRAVWTSELQTVQPFRSRFYSDVTRMRYGPLRDLSHIAVGIALLTVLITLLGLLNIAAHHVKTRTKEIGIRKALGATASSLVALLSQNFLRLVGIAAILTLPAAWLLNQWWLQFLPDPVSVGSGVLIGIVGGLLLLALLTVGSQTLRAARLDPATTLRDE